MGNISYTGYFDYSASTPMKKEVIKAMEPFFSENFYNPSAIYLKSRAVRLGLEEERHKIAETIGAKPSEIIFTAGGTEANNLAINGVMAKYNGRQAVISAIEHDSVIKPAMKFDTKKVSVSQKGLINLDNLVSCISDTTVLVSVMYVNNEVGSIQPIKEVAEIIRSIRKDRQERSIDLPIYLHTDACQAINYLDLSISRLGVDFMTINSGKIYGPKQVGALYVRAGIVLEPLVYGGGQENGLRSGTENVAGIFGFAKALQIAQGKYKSEAKRLGELQNKSLKMIKNEIPNVNINGPSGGKRVANNIHLSIPGVDNEYLLMQLDEQGYQVAVGSACSASSDEPSHVLTAMGISN
ncbi:MAG: Cysteine desulfurase, partial [Patescibacteria group bacterium]|nr:Cysteine desulfurase [Patescibacteria group bacterium]